jgi:hypothetical protein
MSIKSLLNTNDHTVSPRSERSSLAVSAVSAAAAVGRAGTSTGPQTSGGGGVVGGA